MDETRYRLDVLPYVRGIDKAHCVGTFMKHSYEKSPAETNCHGLCFKIANTEYSTMLGFVTSPQNLGVIIINCHSKVL